jgi:hypothetical protein
MINLGIVSLQEVVRPEDAGSFSKIYGIMTEAVHAEMGVVDEGRRVFRNNAGCNRAVAIRWRSKVVWAVT